MYLLAEREDDLQILGKKLNEFRLREHLSFRDLERICGGVAAGVSKSTFQRIVKGAANRNQVLRVQPLLERSLRQYLKNKRYTRAQIDAEMQALFEGGVPRLFTDPSITYDGLSSLGARFDAFRRRHNLTHRKLWHACGGPSVCGLTTVINLCTGASVRFLERIKPSLRANLLQFLTTGGLSITEAGAEIEIIFNGEEHTMFAPRTILPGEAQRFFGLQRDPFTGDPRSRGEVFTTSQLDKIAAKVEDAINYQGFVVVTGEIGSGKSLLKRRTVDTVEQSRGQMRLFWPDFFNMDRVHSGSIVSFLLRSFDQPVPSDLVQRADKLKRVLADAASDSVRVAIGFDECHHLHDRLLTALKNFWELGSGGYDRYLGVVLFGQPQFEGRLRDHRFREICERIEVARMPSFENVAWEYVAHRVRIAGGDVDKLFERGAVKRLAKQAATPLALGNLANAALLRAHNLGERKVVAALVNSDDGEPEVRAIRGAS